MTTDDGVPVAAMSRRVTLAIWTLVAVGVVADIRLLAWYWPGSVFDGITSSDWTALAWDFAHGEFYRPLLGHGGYGGTRFMPLFFVIHGLLIRAHIDPVYGGVFLMQSTILAASLAAFAAMRASSVPARLAAPLAGTVWATILYQKYSTDIRADYLAGALTLAAVALSLASQRDRRPFWLAGASVVCVLAGMTKVTSIAFAGPIALWLWLEGRRSTAIGFVVLTGVLSLAALGVLQWASQGHLLENFRFSASGGMGPGDVWRAPFKFGRWVAIEPFVAVPFLICCWQMIRGRSSRTSLVHIYIAATAVVATIIFMSPGTNSNQVIDVQLAAVVGVGVALHSGGLTRRAGTAIYAALAIVLAAESWPLPGIPSVMATLRMQGPRPRAVVERVRAEFLSPAAPYLSIDPIVPVLGNERAVLLDDFGLANMVREGTPAGRDLVARVRRREFGAVVLRDWETEFPHNMNAGDPGFDASVERYWPGHQDPLSTLFRTAYKVTAVRRPYVILTPASDPG